MNSLKSYVKKFYLQENIKEITLIGEETWQKIKEKVCHNESYLQEEWYLNLKPDDKELIEALRKI